MSPVPLYRACKDFSTTKLTIPGTRAEHHRCRTRSPSGGGAAVQLDLTFPAIFGFSFVAVALSRGPSSSCCSVQCPVRNLSVLVGWLVCENLVADADAIVLRGIQFAGMAIVGMVAGHRTQMLFKACFRAARSRLVVVLVPASTCYRGGRRLFLHYLSPPWLGIAARRPESIRRSRPRAALARAGPTLTHSVC